MTELMVLHDFDFENITLNEVINEDPFLHYLKYKVP